VFESEYKCLSKNCLIKSFQTGICCNKEFSGKLILATQKRRFQNKATSRRQYIQYGADFVVASAAYKIVPFELRHSNAVPVVKVFHAVVLRVRERVVVSA